MRRSQLQHEDSHLEKDGGSESYSSSSYSNSYSGDDSDLANWEEFVLEDGSLFYIEFMLRETCKSHAHPMEFVRNAAARGGKKSCRRQPSINKAADVRSSNASKNSFLFANVNTSEESCKTLELVITAADRFRFGRRSTAVESILGFNVLPFEDQPECLMVDSFVHDMPAFFQQGKHIPIGRGDWFKSLDHIEIRSSNIDELLLQFVEPTKVCLKFQGPLKVDSNADGGIKNTENGANSLHKIENFTQFSQNFEKLLKSNETLMTFGFLILPPECYQNDEHKSSLYHYPEEADNFLFKARGSFLTLNAVLSEELKTKPYASKLTSGGEEYFVFYRHINGFLVLFAYLTSMVTLPEGNLRADELLTYIRFMYPHMNLESFKDLNFRQSMQHFCHIQRMRLLLQKDRKKYEYSLEESLKESRHLPLPKEAQLRIFDALSEMEAMDYRNWNDEPLHTHREFFIYGSTLYYDKFMLISQMPMDMRHYIEICLRCRGIFEFVSRHSTKELYLWEEIQIPDYAGRYFLAVCGRGHLVLSVILKLFCSPDVNVDSKVLPSLFYIEEIQETLDHLMQCGIESLAMFWSVSNKRPEVQDFSMFDGSKQDAAKENKKNDASSINKHAPHFQRSSSYDDNQLCSSLGGSSVHSLTTSEDDSSKKRLIAHADDSDSGSDWENFMDENILRRGFDAELQTQVTESLWKEISNVVPIKISSGWINNIFYYVHVDGANHTTFSPLKSNKDILPFAREMHMAFHRIRKVLQSTKHFRRDTVKPSNSRDLIPVKEYGMTIEMEDVGASATDVSKYAFVVVGRLFLSPPKEVYICHKSDISANMVEMAFRLSFFAADILFNTPASYGIPPNVYSKEVVRIIRTLAIPDVASYFDSGEIKIYRLNDIKKTLLWNTIQE